ncbi:MAG: hypothetical protein R3C46_12925 [Hyphomonadaceae bacterium]
MAVVALFMAATSGLAPGGLAQPATPDFGDDDSTWSNDGECDDKRFAGPGMTNTPLLDEDVLHDATDCRDAWRAGDLHLATDVTFDNDDMPNFGDDDSDWAFDDECDDKRFVGPGMTDTPLLDEDVGHDATDCRNGWEAGELRFIGGDARRGDMPDFGDDDGEWSFDDECDDPRFVGPGMTDTPLLREDMYHDATDCRSAWLEGEIELR